MPAGEWMNIAEAVPSAGAGRSFAGLSDAARKTAGKRHEEHVSRKEKN